jgi:intracellular multiplication protein IcmF
MDKSLQNLCDTLKKIIVNLKPEKSALSCLLLIGKNLQGKNSLLNQSTLQTVSISEDNDASIHYNDAGIIIRLSEDWLSKSKNLLQYTLKRINSCHKKVKITGIILCIDINEFLSNENNDEGKSHALLLQRFILNLNYQIATSIILTKSDKVAGFCEFFQNDHVNDLQKPLGFTLNNAPKNNSFTDFFQTQFDNFIASLEQQVLQKIHPARSSLKRTFIREFPLQLASLRNQVYNFLSFLNSPKLRLHSVFFISSEQGGMSLDKINQKIQHEYAIVAHNELSLAPNYRAYFIDGALSNIQEHTKNYLNSIPIRNVILIPGIIITALLGAALIAYNYNVSSEILDKASRDLIAFDTLKDKQDKTTDATYFLLNATKELHKLGNAKHGKLAKLKAQIENLTEQQIHNIFLPELVQDIEKILMDTKQSPAQRYLALKIYVMFANSKLRDNDAIVHWFKNHWQSYNIEHYTNKNLVLLKHALTQLDTVKTPIKVNYQLITDARNYLNALPPGYLYYSLVKLKFPEQNLDLNIPGFNLAYQKIPVYLTKDYYDKIVTLLPKLAQDLITENWVLARQDLNDLPIMLKQAYNYEYIIWWQNFMQKTMPLSSKDYQQSQNLIKTLQNSDAIKTLVAIIQKETSPNIENQDSSFNQDIASQFTEFNLFGHAAIENLGTNLSDLEHFIRTLSIVHDTGKTAFIVTKSRFQADALSNPLSTLYNTSHQLPEPISKWAKQIADDVWFALIDESRKYLNTAWHEKLLPYYQANIAKRYPFENDESNEVSKQQFDLFFSPSGILRQFASEYIMPFIDVSNAKWDLKKQDGYVLPISYDLIHELMRANIITSMFFGENINESSIDFSLQKLGLDPIVNSLSLTLGNTKMLDDQNKSESFTTFHWPEANARLSLQSIEGNSYAIEESGLWAFFKLLQKLNVLEDEKDSRNLHIMFEINGNAGQYILATKTPLNPFVPGVLNNFSLTEDIA